VELSEPAPPTPHNAPREAAWHKIQFEQDVDVQTWIAGARIERTPLFRTPLSWEGRG